MANQELAELCYELDVLCPNYEFFYTGSTREPAIVVYERDSSGNRASKVHTIECPDHDLDYVVTKIILQFS